MPSLFPNPSALQSVFSPSTPFRRQVEPTRPPFEWVAYSAIDDAKDKAKALSAEATKEIERASAAAQKKAPIELYSAKYYAACTFGGLLACGLTHTAVTPLDLVKCRRQVDSKLYKGNFQAWGLIGRAEGIRGISSLMRHHFQLV